MRKLCCILLCLIMVIGSISVNASTNYESALARVSSFNLIDVTDPDATITRGDSIIALMKIFVRNSLPKTDVSSVFTDVAQDSELLPYSNFAYNMGFVSGMGDGSLAPDEGITLQQFVKIAVSVLGWQSVAENEGGYAGGYMTVATKNGLLKGVSTVEGALTYRQAIILIDNMLDSHTLEMVYGVGDYKVSEETLYEQMLYSGDLQSVSGVVNAVGRAALNGAASLEKGEISVNSIVMSYNSSDADALLGREVTVWYREDGTTAAPVVVSIYINRRNKETAVNAEDITKLDTFECVYYDEDNRNTFVLRLDNAQFVYNGRSIEPGLVEIPETGIVNALDNDGDNRYEIIFIEEYESFIVDKTLAITDTIYFEEGFNFRGKNGVSFDFDDEDKEYEILSQDMQPMEFGDIKEGDSISLWADMKEEKIRVIVCRNQIEGTLSTKDEELVGIGATEYRVYKPNRNEFMSKYELGRTGVFALNHAGEIVDVLGELECRINYGYALKFGTGNGLGSAQIRLVLPGSKDSKVKTSGNTTSTNRMYTNGGIAVFDLNKTITVYSPDGTKERVSSGDLSAAQLERAIVGYELDNDGKIKALHNITSVPNYAAAESYELNGELHSYSDKTEAFYVGESTQVIFVPDKDNPDDEDFEETVTVNDGGEAKVIGVAVDSETQIAECSVVMVRLSEQNLTYETNDVSVVGKIRVKVDDDGLETYTMEVLTGETVQQVYVDSTSDAETVAKTLKAGDLIYYNADDNGKITKIRVLLHLSQKLGNGYYTRLENQEGEEIYGKAKDIRLNYLSALENACVDEVRIDVGSKEKICTFLRKEGPMFYIYDRNDKIVYPGVPEAIQEDVSEVFVYMGASNVPVAVVIVKD